MAIRCSGSRRRCKGFSGKSPPRELRVESKVNDVFGGSVTMKSLRSAVQICLLLCLFPLSTGFASASTVTLSGNILFSSLDGSVQDSDGLANGVFTVNGDLVLDGTINCNDDSSPSGSAGACPIRITTSGGLTMRAGSGIFAENRRGSGAAGSILLTVGGNLTLRGPSGALSGAIVSSSRLSSAAKPAGSTTFS